MIFKIKGGKDDMNQQNKIHVGIHHGARELENNILLQSIPGLKDLHTKIIPIKIQLQILKMIIIII